MIWSVGLNPRGTSHTAYIRNDHGPVMVVAQMRSDCCQSSWKVPSARTAVIGN